jgi:hypothetical protein
MPRNGPDLFIDLSLQNGAATTTTTTLPTLPTLPTLFTLDPTTTLEWDWDIEHADRKLEAKADAEWQSELPFQVDRKVLKDVVRERMGLEVGRIHFLSLGKSKRQSSLAVWRGCEALRISFDLYPCRNFPQGTSVIYIQLEKRHTRC